MWNMIRRRFSDVRFKLLADIPVMRRMSASDWSFRNTGRCQVGTKLRLARLLCSAALQP